MARPKLLSTKKLEPALAAAARERFDLDEAELISIQPIDDEVTATLIRKWIGRQDLDVAFTSAHAAEALKPFLPNEPLRWRLFCLPGKTRAALEQKELQGLGTIVDTAPDASALAAGIIRHGVKELLFFCGDRRRDELPRLLQAAGIAVHEAIVYRTVEIPVPMTTIYDGLLFFSPSAVHSFFEANELPETTVCFALGATTAAALRRATTNTVIAAAAPTQQALLDAARHYFDQTPKYK